MKALKCNNTMKEQRFCREIPNGYEYLKILQYGNKIKIYQDFIYPDQFSLFQKQEILKKNRFDCTVEELFQRNDGKKVFCSIVFDSYFNETERVILQKFKNTWERAPNVERYRNFFRLKKFKVPTADVYRRFIEHCCKYDVHEIFRIYRDIQEFSNAWKYYFSYTDYQMELIIKKQADEFLEIPQYGIIHFIV